MSYEPVTKDDELVDKVWEIMQHHNGFDKRIGRDHLTASALGWVSPNNDRKVRDALAELPVIWQDGYFIPATQDEADAYIASMHSRQAAIGQRLKVLDDYLRQTREPARQLRLDEAFL